MDADLALRTERRGDVLPTAVGGTTGLSGLIGLFAGLWATAFFELGAAAASLVCLAACAVPMILWSVAVEKVHRNPGTGIDFSCCRPFSDTLRTTAVKLAGLWFTWAAIAAFYWGFRWYAGAQFAYYFAIISATIPYLLLLSVAYVFFVDRRLRDPYDELWHVGKWVLGDWKGIDSEKLRDYARGWFIKAFFLAFMFSLLPRLITDIVVPNQADVFASLTTFVTWAIQFMFLIDLSFATIGYVLTLRILDSHIRSTNPYASAWAAALVCYPPFAIMHGGGPLDYRTLSDGWTFWFQNHEWMLALWGALLLVLTAIYASATVIFGIRFSNLTHRGIITNGPYRYLRHPAYLSKNLFWWLVHVPFLSTAGYEEAIRNSLLLLSVNLIYFLRAKTEEKHLMTDPAYQQYSAWIKRHGVLPSAWRFLQVTFLCWKSRSGSPKSGLP